MLVRVYECVCGYVVCVCIGMLVFGGMFVCNVCAVLYMNVCVRARDSVCLHVVYLFVCVYGCLFVFECRYGYVCIAGIGCWCLCLGVCARAYLCEREKLRMSERDKDRKK